MSVISYFWKVKDYLQSKRKGISYIASSDGSIYQVRESKIGKMVAKANHIPSLDNVREVFHFDLPKIPDELFQQIYSFFKTFCDRSDVEVMLQIFFDTETGDYLLECPVQKVNKARVEAELDPKLLGKNSLRYIQVAQVHSHNSMNAYFSATDDADEKAFMIYGVFGKLDTTEPQCMFRVKSNDSYLIINALDIFESIKIKERTYPVEWEENVLHF